MKKTTKSVPQFPYKEYKGSKVSRASLRTDYIKTSDYTMIHKYSTLVCHDIFIKVKQDTTEGYLLVRRKNHPAKNVLWPIGGRLLRGLSAEDSLRRKVLLECSLHLKDVRFLGVSRTLFKEGPFAHKKGTDSVNLLYCATGKGTIRLDNDHEKATIITKQDFKKKKKYLPQYTADILEYIYQNNLW